MIICADTLKIFRLNAFVKLIENYFPNLSERKITLQSNLRLYYELQTHIFYILHICVLHTHIFLINHIYERKIY